MLIVEFSPQKHHGTKDFNSFFGSSCLGGEPNSAPKRVRDAGPGVLSREIKKTEARLLAGHGCSL